ncbi:hypothetical protein Hanom_Chr00s002973g01707401 [Helianthus anomalus]
MKVRTPFGTCLPPCRRSEAKSEATEATTGSTRHTFGMLFFHSNRFVLLIHKNFTPELDPTRLVVGIHSVTYTFQSPRFVFIFTKESQMNNNNKKYHNFVF